jgi:O-antigen/teichoic acid export membrane protein
MVHGRAHSNRDAAMTRRAQPISAIVPDAAGMGLRNRFNDAWILVHRWKGRIFFAFADQGLFSTTNFILTILYATWLPLDGFGRYVVVWTVALFVEAIQISLIVDSLPAIVSRYGRRNRERMDIAAFWVVAAFSVASSLVIAGSAAILSTSLPDYAGPLYVLALVNPLQRVYLFFRRLSYIRDRQSVAASAALAYGAASILGAWALAFLHLISVGAVIALSGLGSAAAILVIFLAGIGRLNSIRPIIVLWLASHIWSSGRWLTPASIMSWLVNWGMFPLAAAISGAGAAGVVRALQNLLTPVVQFNAALNIAILPRVADKVADHGLSYARHFALRATAIFTAFVVAYCGLILATAHIFLPALYKKPEIAASAYLLWPLALAIIGEASRIASSMALLATRRTRVVFLARLASLTAFVVGGIVLGYWMGFAGILWANALGNATGAAVVIGAALRLDSEI